MFGDSFFVALDNFLHGLNDSIGKSAASQCRLETLVNKHVIAADDDSLVSCIRLRGTVNLIGNEEYDTVNDKVTEGIASRMSKPGHGIQFLFRYDPDASADLAGLFRQSRITASNLGLDVGMLFDDMEESINRYCASEQTFVAVWTRPNSLPPSTQRGARKARIKERKGVAYWDPPGSQTIMRGLKEITDSHEAFVDSLLRIFSSAGLLADVMDAHSILWHARNIIDRNRTSRDWRALLPGDPPPHGLAEPGEHELFRFVYPSIGRQIYPRDPINVGNFLQVGESWHASAIMSLPPQKIQPFNMLFKSMLAAKIPWAVSFLVESDGFEGMAVKRLLNAVLALSSSDNKMLKKAFDELHEMYMQNQAIVRLRVVFSTSLHGESDRSVAVDILSKRMAALVAAAQSWGSPDVSDVVDDPLLGLQATLPCVMPKSPGTAAAAPLDDVVSMLPLSRPASIWDEGNLVFRSPDGKLMPCQVGSSKQAAWVDLGVSPMGGGKSVLLNTINFAFCTQPGLARLPWLSVTDVGPSSSGLIELIRAGLPNDKKWLAQYHRLRMERDYAINVFDTPLGMYEPLPRHFSFLVNFISLLSTGLNDNAPQDAIAGIARSCIKAAYEEVSPRHNPKLYTRHAHTGIDAALESLGFAMDHRTSWWEVADFLFDQGREHDAISAQRYAVPLLPEVAGMAKRDIVTGVYRNKTAGQELVTDYFWRCLVDAVSAYPILGMPTRFDIGDAQIVSLDLDEVAPRGGPDADRQAAVMYMLANHVLGSRFFLMPKDAECASPRYRAWHAQRIDAIRQDPKRICWDEAHRVMRNANVARQVAGDIEIISRESRKWNLSLGLYSQDIADYPDIIIELATSIYIMGVGTVRAAEILRARFGLNQTAFEAMQRLGTPDRRGANFLAVFKTSRGQTVQALTNTIGVVSLWAFSTTSEDVTVRNKLYGILGVSETLKRLAGKYPGGVKAEIETRKLVVMARGWMDDNIDHIAAIVEEIVRME